MYKYKKPCLEYLELTGAKDSYGYKVMCINKKNYKAHRLIMYNFKKNENYANLQVNHKDGNKLNNCILNLEWCSSGDNIRHAWDNGLSRRTKESIERHKNSMISKIDISILFDKNAKYTKKRIKSLLKSRGIDIDNYQFIKTDKNKTNHGLGYIKNK